jgi:hypothetical protein
MNEKPRVGNNTPDDLIKRSDAIKTFNEWYSVKDSRDFAEAINSIPAAPTAPIDNVREEVEMGCRDCSDNFGTCPNTGLPCGT